MKRRTGETGKVADADELAAMHRECRKAAKAAVRLARHMRKNPGAAMSIPLRDFAHMLSVTSGAGRTYANILKGTGARNGY